MIRRLFQRLRTFGTDQRGAVIVVYALLLAGFVIMMLVVFDMLFEILMTLFEMTVFLLDLPFI